MEPLTQAENRFNTGVVMAYYGTIWSQQTIIDYATFCHDQQLAAFIYAPKLDHDLRRDWRMPLSVQKIEWLATIRNHYTATAFGIGLSLCDISAFDPATKQALLAKLQQLNALNIDVLGIFFDDIEQQYANHNLAVLQKTICEFCCEHSSASTIHVVPSWYCDDGILTRQIGNRPADYLTTLGSLDSAIQIYWSGSHIQSSHYCGAELAAIAEQLQRKPLIWDNYPVTDPHYLHGFLRLLPPPASQPYLRRYASGFYANPMQYGYCSMIPLAAINTTISHVECDRRVAFLQALNECCEPALARVIDANVNSLMLQGCHQLEANHRQRLLDVFQQFDHEIANEICTIINSYPAYRPTISAAPTC